ncbi:MAG: hypothetical protein RR207_05890 [Clostridia bacterium]
MLQIIQGDIFELCIDICNIDPVAIEKVEFSSKDLGVQENVKLYKNRYTLRIAGEKTKSFKEGFVRYDLTITFIDKEVLTIKRNDKIEVLSKVNKVNMVKNE